MTTIQLDGHSLTVEGIVRVARHGAPVKLTVEARAAIRRGTELLESLIAEGRPVYGVTTGFGALDTREVSPALRRALQRNLILSHACAVGAPMPADAVRGMMVIRANCLAQGLTGVRPHTVEALLAMLNGGIVPVVPEKGSVCACGDLAPLAHMVLPLIGMGEADVSGRRLPGAEALAAIGLAPITLDGRDGLALINGTEQASSLLALAVWDAVHVLHAAEIAAAMTHEALGGVRDAFDARVHAAKPFATQAAVARHLRALLEGSQRAIPEARPGRLRDALSLRCTPQVLGAAGEAVQFATRLVEVEVNAANDNPLLFPDDGTSISNSGNFHGQYVGMAADLLGMAVLSAGVISERRTARLVDEKLNAGLPAFLIQPDHAQEGVHSGFMIAQYTAASLVAEGRTLTVPASVQSVPTCANSEDHVSMASIAARKARHLVEDVRYIVAIELLCAAQALDLRGMAGLGRGTAAAHAAIRAHVPYVKADTALNPHIERIAGMIREGSLLAGVEDAVGTLG